MLLLKKFFNETLSNLLISFFVILTNRIITVKKAVSTQKKLGLHVVAGNFVFVPAGKGGR